MPSDRVITVSIPAIGSEYHFTRLDGIDRVSRPFDHLLTIASPDLNLKPEDVLGTAVTVTIAGEVPRHLNGLVSDFGLQEIRNGLGYFTMTLRPWLWFLSLTTDNRIFQDQTVPDILDTVLGAAGGRYSRKLEAKHPTRSYCVQYGESDLDFVQRLMEDEGISYYFTHGDGTHEMVLIDAPGGFQALEVKDLPYASDHQPGTDAPDLIHGWSPRQQVRPGRFTSTDYDFERPSFDLTATDAQSHGHSQDAGELYHYPGHYLTTGDGDATVARRIREAQADRRSVVARSTAVHLAAGRVFTLTGFPREAENGDYRVIRASYRFWDEQLRSGAVGGIGAEVEVEATPTAADWRPPRITPRPRMAGPQTAIVTGPAGEEIYTDKYGRVKVQFHWDRLGKRDEATTCFIRVSQTWAGAGWGFIQIPRIGQEVIVDFLDGDPDRPIITGRVYNGAQPVPYGLPGNATQSGWKSRSTPHGTGWNELRFEDKTGSEQVYFQAEKDHVELVKNDETRTIGHDFSEDVGHDATQGIGHDRTETVGNDKSVTVGRHRSVSIGVNDTETVGSNRSLSVGANETISVGSNSSETIGANHTQTVGISQTLTVGAARVRAVGAAETVTVGAAQAVSVGAGRDVNVGGAQAHVVGAGDSWQIGADQTVTIGAAQSLSIGDGQTVTIGKDQALTISGSRVVKVAKDEAHEVGGGFAIKVGKALIVEAADSIVLKCGAAAIAMKKDGTITIEGKDISIKGSGKVNVKASGDVTVKGSKVLNN